MITEDMRAQWARCARLAASTDGRGPASEPSLGAARARREELYLLATANHAHLPPDDEVKEASLYPEYIEFRHAQTGNLSECRAREIGAYFYRSAACAVVRDRKNADDLTTFLGGYVRECRRIADRYHDAATGHPRAAA